MSFFVTATEADQPKARSVHIVSLVLAGLLILLAVGQLFTYEKFADIIDGYGFFTDKAAMPIVAALIVTLEVAAIPFLLRMRLSPLARVVSMASGWIVLLFWWAISLWLNGTFSLAPNSGVLGDTVTLPVGGWMITFFMTLLIIDIYATYGMWPFNRQHKS